MKQYKVPVFKPDLPPDYAILAGYREIQKSGVVSNFGQFAEKFEGIAKDYLQNENALVVSSCDTGLMLSIKALDLPKGTPVAVTSFTFTSTINAIEWNGLVPVFIDIDRKTFNMSPKSLAEELSSWKSMGCEIKLIMPTHIFGNPCDIHAIEHLAHAYDCEVIYDGAHAYGSKYCGEPCDFSTTVYSFSGTKLVTSGEGGLITSNNKDILHSIKFLRGYGFYGDYNCRDNGLNGKISEFNAMVGTYTLPLIEAAVKQRNDLVAAYKKKLGDAFEYQYVDPANRSSYKDFAIICKSKEQRDKIYNNMEKHEIQTKKYFMPLHYTDKYKDVFVGGLENTEWVYDHTLCIPLFNSITEKELEEVVNRIKEVV